MNIFKTQEKPATRGLSWTDSTGTVYQYYSKPLSKACVYILVQEACERLAYYGIMPNLQTFFIRSLGVDTTRANSLVNIFTALVYFTPMISAVIADSWLGSFYTILAFSGVYIAGLALLCVAALVSVSQHWMVYVSLFVLIAIGAGGIKSCVNVMGASQFHPTEHQEQITRFFTFFYAAINVGAIFGGIVVPIVQQVTDNYFIGYLIPLGSFFIATAIFWAGSPRYVKMNPQGSQIVQIAKVIGTSIRNWQPINMCKESNGGRFKDQFIEDSKSLGYLVPLFVLTVPFNVCYNQMTTAFLTQGEKMKSDFFGIPMTPSLMQNVDPIAVILGSLFVEYLVYSKLRSWGRMPSILTRFCIGCCMGTISLLCAMGLELCIMRSSDPWESISIWWQVPQFTFIALGEIFLISTSYEVAFTYSPESLKAVGSGVNLMFMAVASFISAALFEACAPWMPNYSTTDPASWQDSHYDYFFAMLAVISFLSGIASLSLNGYFNRHVVKPSERNNAERDNTMDVTLNLEEAHGN